MGKRAESHMVQLSITLVVHRNEQRDSILAMNTAQHCQDHFLWRRLKRRCQQAVQKHHAGLHNVAFRSATEQLLIESRWKYVQLVWIIVYLDCKRSLSLPLPGSASRLHASHKCRDPSVGA